MSMSQDGVQVLIATDASVTAASTFVAGTDYTAVSIDTRDRKNGNIIFYVKGANAGSSGNMIFTMQHSDDDTIWFDFDTKTIALSGVSQITDTTASFRLKLLGYKYLRLGSIENTDTTYACGANAGIYMEG